MFTIFRKCMAKGCPTGRLDKVFRNEDYDAEHPFLCEFHEELSRKPTERIVSAEGKGFILLQYQSPSIECEDDWEEMPVEKAICESCRKTFDRYIDKPFTTCEDCEGKKDE